MKTDQITEKIDKLLQIAPWLPTPENLSSLMKNLSNYKNYKNAHECFYQWLGQCNKAKNILEELLENLEPLKKEQEEKLYNDLKKEVPVDLTCHHCGAGHPWLMRVIKNLYRFWTPEVVIHCCVCGKELEQN